MFAETKRERLQDFLTTLLDVVPEHFSYVNCLPSQPGDFIQYREIGDQLAYNLDSAIEITVKAGYMEAAVTSD